MEEIIEAAAKAWDEGHEAGFWNGRLSAGILPSESGKQQPIGVEHAKLTNPYRKGSSDAG